ncbi:MAG TPA: ABC transporter permease [Kofleriaceae bacterium]|nr:ABC transporter permease [Kofleriaceae bacterium]
MAVAEFLAMRGFATDLRQAARGLARAPWVTGMIVVTLALGIGAPTAVFSVVNAVLLRPLSYPGADRLVMVRRVDERGQIADETAGAAFLAWRDQARSLAGMAAWRGANLDLRTGDGPRRIRGAIVTSSFFPVMGSAALLGRAQSVERGTRQVVLGERLWRRQFSGDRDVVGRPIVLGGESFTVAGVMPASFEFPGGAELWLGAAGPVPEHSARPFQDQSTRWDSNYFQVVGRLAGGASLASAQAEMDGIGARLARDNPGYTPHLVPLRDALASSSRAPLLIVLGAVSLILLIACVNVSHLLLARAMQRHHEIAVRMALGANRARVARLFFAESVVLAAVGGVLGTLVALWGAPPLVALGPRWFHAESISADPRVLVFAGLLSFAAALVSSLIPALSGQLPAEALKQAGRSVSLGSGGRWTRSLLVGLEVGLAVVLLATAGLLGRSYLRLQSVDTGFRPAGVLTAELLLPPARYRSTADQTRFVERVLGALRARGEVKLAGVVSQLPMSASSSSRDVDIDPGADSGQIQADLRSTAPDYLGALGIPLLAGRAIDARDTAGSEHVAVVNELFARRAWPGENPLGKRIGVQLDQKPSVVVGVVGNILHSGLDSEKRPEVYIPYAAEPRPSMSLVVRGAVAPEALAPMVREVVASIDPDLALARVETMEQRIATSLGPTRFRTLLFVVAAGLALVLALTGIYGVIAYAVGHRRRELGIRLALGAKPGRLVAAVMAQSLRPVAAGVVAGVAASLVLARLLVGLLFGVAPTDPVTYAAIALVAAATACLASFAAARRATLADPMSAIRAD